MPSENIIIAFLRKGIYSSLVCLLGAGHPNISIITEIGVTIVSVICCFVFLFVMSTIVGLFIYFSLYTFYSLLISLKVNILLDWVLKTKMSSLISSFFSQLPAVKHTHVDQMMELVHLVFIGAIAKSIVWPILSAGGLEIFNFFQGLYDQWYNPNHWLDQKSLELPVPEEAEGEPANPAPLKKKDPMTIREENLVWWAGCAQVTILVLLIIYVR